MEDSIIIGIDLAKNVFQLHGASRDGHVLFRKKLNRPEFTGAIFVQNILLSQACWGYD